MGFKEFITSSKRIVEVVSRPKRKETWLMIKVTLIGIAAIGAIGFIIQVLFMIVGLSPG